MGFSYWNCRLSEAETVLTGNVGDLISTSTCTSYIESIISDYGDSAAFALQLISHIWWHSERSHLAAEACRKALCLNPFLWQSFQDLCDRGVKPDPEPTKIFKVNHLKYIYIICIFYINILLLYFRSTI